MNKKYFIGIGIMFIGALFVIIKLVILPSNDIKDIDFKDIENKMISCVENKLNNYIDFNNSKEILMSDITDKKDKIEYFKGISDDKNMYIMFKEYNGTYEYDVMKDFDLYFIDKFDIYQKFDMNYGMSILLHTDKNDVDYEQLIGECNMDLPISYKTEFIPLVTINELRKTNKIVFGNYEISDKIIIDKIINIVENSSKKFYKGLNHAYLCDGPGEMFMYDSNGKLIDTLYIFGDGKRLIPKSISKEGCEYFNTKEDIRRVIEEGTNIIYHTYVDYSEVCATSLELIYEDDNYKYYFNCIKSDFVLIYFTLSNKVMKLKYALNNNYIDIDQLITYDNLIIKEKK